MIKGFLQLVFRLLRIDVVLDGTREWDMRINDYPAMLRALTYGELGLGEAYMHHVWTCPNIELLFCHLKGELPPFLARKHQKEVERKTGDPSYAYEVGKAHYDLPVNLYKVMLDKKWMTYTCAYWDGGAVDLETAQEDKMRIIARKLALKPGMRVLDIGSGWGSLGAFLVQNYHVQVVGLTVSQEQADCANQKYGSALCGQFTTLVEDYRQHHPKVPYDRIVSVGMFEHVGQPSYRTYFECVKKMLVSGGIFVLHTINEPKNRMKRPSPWTAKYIFPNSAIPSLAAIMKASKGLLTLVDTEQLGSKNYAKTLRAWRGNILEALEAHHLDFSSKEYPPHFKEMFVDLYLGGAAGNFEMGKMDVLHCVFRKK